MNEMFNAVIKFQKFVKHINPLNVGPVFHTGSDHALCDLHMCVYLRARGNASQQITTYKLFRNIS